MYEYDPVACMRQGPVYEPPTIVGKPRLATRLRRSIAGIGRLFPAETWALIAAVAILLGTLATLHWK